MTILMTCRQISPAQQELHMKVEYSESNFNWPLISHRPLPKATLLLKYFIPMLTMRLVKSVSTLSKETGIPKVGIWKLFMKLSDVCLLFLSLKVLSTRKPPKCSWKVTRNILIWLKCSPTLMPSKTTTFSKITVQSSTTRKPKTYR